MKKMDSYGLRLCKFQAELFQWSRDHTDYSSRIFVRRFMFSDLARRMDADGFLFEAITVTDALYEIDDQFGPSQYGNVKFSNEELYWTGYLYRYWAYVYAERSKHIYRIVKPEELRKLYFPYHSLDPEQAIERIRESKGITSEDDIKRGVEILRKVRNAKAHEN